MKLLLNGQEKGVFIVRRLDDGEFLLGERDLKSIGLLLPPGESTLHEGEGYRPLRSIQGMSHAFDEKILTLELTAAPNLFPKQVFDLRPGPSPDVYFPRDPGGFLNYAVTYTGGNSLSFESLDVAGELGIRWEDYLFFTSSSYAHQRSGDRFARLMTNVTYDARRSMQRLILGDFQVPASGPFGTGVLLGGVSFSKVFRIDPYYVYYPTTRFSGEVSSPASAEISVDGTRIRTEKLLPGEYDFRNIWYIGGRRDVSLVLRDPFGREERVARPFYFADTVLREGAHEYSYNLGFRREDFGEESNRYGSLAFSAFHNYGVNDSLTVGFRGEGDEEFANLGPQASYRSDRVGLFSVSVAGSLGEGNGAGGAAAFSHQYQDPRLGTRLLLLGQSRDFSAFGGLNRADRLRYLAGAGASYGTADIGFFALDYAVSAKQEGPALRVASARYTKNVLRSLNLQLSFTNARERESANTFFAGLTYYPLPDTSLSTSFRRIEETNAYTVQAQKNQPVGEGWGYRVTAARIDAPDASTTSVNPFVQYNAKRGTLSAEYVGDFTDPGKNRESYRLSTAGGVAYVGGAFGLSRPVTDSFGLVTVDNLAGVRVYQNNQEIGRTDARGRVFVPSMGSYVENQISIADSDVPMDYSLGEVTRLVSPPLRSGSVIRFDARKYRAVTGKLAVKLDGKVRPVEYHEIRTMVSGKELSFPTGKGGEFYLENLPPGTYEAAFEFEGRKYGIALKIPESEETIVDLGEIDCE
ncbi:MAG TPA: fimbria/pilus outer membrane usher protein [Candidatus Deferrimicrobiaceae bacterium]